MSGPRSLRNFIAGEYVDGRTETTTDIVNPATGSVVATAPVSGQADVDAAYGAAETAFAQWGRTTPSERQQALDALADGGLGEPDGLRDGGVRLPAVLLEQLDDALRHVVEPGLGGAARGPGRGCAAGHRAMVTLIRSPRKSSETESVDSDVPLCNFSSLSLPPPWRFRSKRV